MRVRKDFARPEGNKSARLVVIAAEGRETENIYFEALKDKMCASNVHVEVLHRDTDESSPEHVFTQIRDFMAEYNIEDDDQLWIVVDKDRWTAKMLASVARHCQQNKNLYFCVSNPCFELWLLLHLEDIALYSDEDRDALAANRKNSRHGKTWLKRRLAQILGGYDEADYNAEALLPEIQLAIDRSIILDVKATDRWPQTTGTRVYQLAKSITGK